MAEAVKPDRPSDTGLEAGTYELLHRRIVGHAKTLQSKLHTLNEERKQVFGAIETKILATERVTTNNNCIPWDMHSFGSRLLFGYNVHVGLRNEVQISDVFSYYEYTDHTFKELGVTDFINDPVFLDDFGKLYKYYKNSQFLRFKAEGPFLYMVFRVGQSVNDVKTFKWSVDGDRIKYVDNRSDHEYRFPAQHEFVWTKTRREHYRDGLHPHVSIEERVFVETVGGDLTVKIEDNTEDGEGIYSEDVKHKEQTLDDAEFSYALVGQIIVIKATPYQEDSRYLIFNEKLKEVRRIDAIKDACVLLPDDHGLIFSNGYYLQSGEYKTFDLDLDDMIFEKRIGSLNGEDYLFVFYNRMNGVYLLLNYNIISQKVENPIVCHGYTIFENGELCVFRADEEPKKHHAIQIWQTPFTGPNYKATENKKSYLQKIGNKDVVRAMAECQEVIGLVNREEKYADLYLDLVKKSTDILDTYYWIGDQENYDLKSPLTEVREVAESAVDEFEKVRRLTDAAERRVAELHADVHQLIKKSKASFGSVDQYVALLGDIRQQRGAVISAKDMRYIAVPTLDTFDKDLAKSSDIVSESCVRFLMQAHALEPYIQKVRDFQGKIDEVKKVAEADELVQQGEQIANELDLLIETVSNLKITDATQTTSIIEQISEIYGEYNQVKAKLSSTKKSLLSIEGKAEFGAMLKLLEQSTANFLDVADSPAGCDEYLTKLVVQIEELEGKFSEFDEFIEVIAQKREEVYNAFEAKKYQLSELRSKKSNQIYQAAERVLNAVKNKAKSLEDKSAINSYFASDLMVEKVRSLASQLVEMEETVKADDVHSQLKTIREDILRQLKDRQELFQNGDNIISMGNYKFYTNKLELDLSMVSRKGRLSYHLSGTDFFEPIESDELIDLEEYWDRQLISENESVYRSEYLAYILFSGLIDKSAEIGLHEFTEYSEKEKLEFVRKEMVARYQEGYIKGIHEYDTNQILSKLVEFYSLADVMKYDSATRALGKFCWNHILDEELKSRYQNQFNAASLILSVFPDSSEFEPLVDDLRRDLEQYSDQTYTHSCQWKDVANYLFDQLRKKQEFEINGRAAEIYLAFQKYIKSKRVETKFTASLNSIKDSPALAVRLIRNWVNSYISEIDDGPAFFDYVDEISLLILDGDYLEQLVVHIQLEQVLDDMKGDHQLLNDGKYPFHLNRFLRKMSNHYEHDVPRYQRLQQLKKSLSAEFKSQLRLEEFRPRVLSSFVRNQLIDQVYFPLIGANLAKQIGTAGEGKRTDLMGLLLLISPPGYGKTTLMEYIASRLGVIFMKINGPAIGHEVTSLDPADAPNAASGEELQKLNLSFEMGNNVMIYLDDIQHCNPEFLQKFISMCDAQRKIEGVYKGKTKTYDFRGKKVCVVMAGNPYTESGAKFQIPDMLANRADTYNLGDVIGETEDAFKMSYIENCLTSNQTLGNLVSKSLKDVHAIMKTIESGSVEGITFEGNHSGDELQEYQSVLRHLIRVRDVVLKVNQLYIQSAAMSDEYRVEPAFKLQGSYRDMNKMAEKILPLMNDSEVEVVIQSHYQNEAQTLTSNAEANLLKFKEITGVMSSVDAERWAHICEKFKENQKKLGYGSNAAVASGLESISSGLQGIADQMIALSSPKSRSGKQQTTQSKKK